MDFIDFNKSCFGYSFADALKSYLKHFAKPVLVHISCCDHFMPKRDLSGKIKALKCHYLYTHPSGYASLLYSFRIKMSLK